MSKQRRAACVEFAEIDALIADLAARITEYKLNPEMDWSGVETLRYYKMRLRELVGVDG